MVVNRKIYKKFRCGRKLQINNILTNNVQITLIISERIYEYLKQNIFLKKQKIPIMTSIYNDQLFLNSAIVYIIAYFRYFYNYVATYYSNFV